MRSSLSSRNRRFSGKGVKNRLGVPLSQIIGPAFIEALPIESCRRRLLVFSQVVPILCVKRSLSSLTTEQQYERITHATIIPRFSCEPASGDRRNRLPVSRWSRVSRRLLEPDLQRQG